MKCNLCGHPHFGPMGTRPTARCLSCNSLERTRLLWMYLQRLNLTAESRVLHLAPDFGIWRQLSAVIPAANYHLGDINPAGYPFAGQQVRKIDLTDLDGLPDNYYDLILHSHVLEHVPCNIAYPLYHLHRALKPGGKHMFVIPFAGKHYDECLGGIDEAERIRRFGQNDHIRLFGVDDIDQSLGSVLRFEKNFDATRDFSPAQLMDANIPAESWKGLTPNTVLCVAKTDMRMLHA